MQSFELRIILRPLGTEPVRSPGYSCASRRRKRKSPDDRAFPGLLALRGSGGPDIGGLVAFGAGGLVITDLLAFLERLEPRVLDCGEMRKQILAAVIRRDKSKSLCVVEPLHGTCSHVFVFLND